MSDLGEISAELSAALDRLDRVLDRFHEIDRLHIAAIQDQVARDPKLRHVGALIARARSCIRQAGNGVVAARRAGGDWLAQHGSPDAGRSSAGQSMPVHGEGLDVGSSGLGHSAAVDAAWAERLRTPGGMAFFPATEPELRLVAGTLPSFPGEYTFDAHGSSYAVEFDGNALTAAEVAELIRADERWGHRPVRLFSCNTGRGENPIAAELAAELGVRVIAPDDVVWSDADGWVGVAPVKKTKVEGVVVEIPDCERAGSWRVFEPPSSSGKG